MNILPRFYVFKWYPIDPKKGDGFNSYTLARTPEAALENTLIMARSNPDQYDGRQFVYTRFPLVKIVLSLIAYKYSYPFGSYDWSEHRTFKSKVDFTETKK